MCANSHCSYSKVVLNLWAFQCVHCRKEASLTKAESSIDLRV